MTFFAFGVSCRLKQFCMGQLAYIAGKIRSQNVHFRASFWGEQNLAGTIFFLSLTRFCHRVI